MSWSMRVVGIAPPGLDYPRGTEFWVAANYGSDDVIARLKPNATAEAARKEFQAFLGRDPDETSFTGANTLGAQVHTVTDEVIGDARAPLIALRASMVPPPAASAP